MKQEIDEATRDRLMRDYAILCRENALETAILVLEEYRREIILVVGQDDADDERLAFFTRMTERMALTIRGLNTIEAAT